MKKTKVVCTMGPNTNDRELMRKLIQNGMDVARFNFSHGDHEEQKGRMDMLKELREEEHATTAILLDTKGPEIRTGILKDGKKIKLETGNTFTLTTEDIVGDENKVSITYKGLAEDVSEGKVILIDDGLIGLKVIGKTDKEIHCEIINGGELGEKKGVNVPGVPVRLPAITEKDKEDIKFGAEQGIDFIAASFVRNAECILEIKAYLKSLGAPYIPIIAKIENEEGISKVMDYIHLLEKSGDYKLAEIIPIHVIRERKVFYTTVSAGTGSFLDGEDYEMYSSPDIPEEAAFGVHISGDSMEPRYHNEELVWIEQTEQLDDGEIGIFYLDGNAYIKKFQNNRKGTYLISLNRKYDPIPITENSSFKIFGRVLS